MQPLEIAPPSIARWSQGNVGIPFVWQLKGAHPGPHCAIVALTHGNEYCGAIVLNELLDAGFVPKRGALSLIFANVDAFSRFDEHAPFASRYVDEDFNRVWDIETLAGPRQSRELTRARALRAYIDSVDHLLDLHSMHEPGAPILLCGTTKKGLAQARQIGMPAHVLIDGGHRAGRRLFDYATFSDDASDKTAYLVECGQHWAVSSVHVARESVQRFLQAFGLTGAAVASTLPAQTIVKITHAITVQGKDAFQWTQRWEHLQVVPTAQTVIGHDGGAAIATPYDNCVLVMPTPHPLREQTAVRLGQIVR